MSKTKILIGTRQALLLLAYNWEHHLTRVDRITWNTYALHHPMKVKSGLVVCQTGFVFFLVYNIDKITQGHLPISHPPENHERTNDE